MFFNHLCNMFARVFLGVRNITCKIPNYITIVIKPTGKISISKCQRIQHCGYHECLIVLLLNPSVYEFVNMSCFLKFQSNMIFFHIKKEILPKQILTPPIQMYLNLAAHPIPFPTLIRRARPFSCS
jgi:hypothetical protein